MDPIDIERKITPHTKAIMPVHMLNLVCNMDAIIAIAKKYNLKVIEDACQAVGAKYKNRHVGTLGDAGAFSFNQFKNLNAGEGGAVLTNNDRIFTRARNYHDAGSYTRNHEFDSNEPFFAGMNLKVSELSAAVMYAQLSRLEPYLRRMQRHRSAIAETLSQGRSFRISPHNDPDNALGLTVVFEDADAAKCFATNRGVTRLIDTGRHVYTNWQPIMTQRVFDERMNPYRWANRKIEYSPDMCPNTLDILARTCSVSLGIQYPLSLVRLAAKRLPL
jgi:dTDP-4-amino-4,6-dideoxygalactose transaminase